MLKHGNCIIQQLCSDKYGPDLTICLKGTVESWFGIPRDLQLGVVFFSLFSNKLQQTKVSLICAVCFHINFEVYWCYSIGCGSTHCPLVFKPKYCKFSWRSHMQSAVTSHGLTEGIGSPPCISHALLLCCAHTFVLLEDEMSRDCLHLVKRFSSGFLR